MSLKSLNRDPARPPVSAPCRRAARAGEPRSATLTDGTRVRLIARHQSSVIRAAVRSARLWFAWWGRLHTDTLEGLSGTLVPGDRLRGGEVYALQWIEIT